MKHLLSLFLLCLTASHAQSPQKTDFLEAQITIRPDTVTRGIEGTAAYKFLAPAKRDTVSLDAVNMKFNSVAINGSKVPYTYDGKKLKITARWKAGKTYELQVSYSCQPEQTVYFVGWDDANSDNNQIWTQGQGKYTSHWVPSSDDMNEKIEFDLRIGFDPDYEVLANGALEGTETDSGVKYWEFHMEQPMSSYLLAFAIGKYQQKTLQSESNKPIHLYYYPQDSLKVEPTYRYSKEIFDFLEKEIGIPYPWQLYRQAPVKDFLYAGMENTACTLFSDAYVVDSLAFRDRNFVNINAHELAHQWFGNLVTEESGADHWLHEGFATYYAYETERQLFGNAYFYWKWYDTAMALQRMSEQGEGEALTDPGAGSLTFYEKGAWALYMLRHFLGGPAFREGMQAFLKKYSYRNATVADFLEVMASSSGKSLEDFSETWLTSRDFPIREAMAHLRQSSPQIDTFLRLQEEATASPAQNGVVVERYWKANADPHWREHVIKRYYQSLPETFVVEILKEGDWRVRQAVALEAVQVSSGLKPGFESLLSDASYLTVEAALYKLWIYFDGDRPAYLNRCRDLIGLPNRNVRLLWLTLAMLTPGYDEANKAAYYSELRDYTSPTYGFETRQLAFEYLKEAFRFDAISLANLIKACVHPAWQFRSFARNLLATLLAEESYRKLAGEVAVKLNGEELRYIKQKLDSK